MTKTIKISFILAVFFLPFGIKIGEIFNFQYVTYLYSLFTVIAFILLISKNRFKLSVSIVPYPIVLFLLYTFIHIFIVYTFFFPKYFFKPEIPQIDPPFINVIRYIIYIQFLYVFVSLTDYTFFKKIIKAYTWGYLFTFIIGYLAVYFKWVPVEIRLEGRFAGGFDNPNSFGVVSTMILFLNLFLLLSEKERKEPFHYLNLVFVLIASLGIFISQSRMTFFGLLFGMFFMFLKIKSVNRKLKFFLLLGFLTCVFVIIVPKDIIEGVFKRISKHSITGQNGQKESRILIWSDYLSKAPTYAVQGVGFNRELVVDLKSYRTNMNYVPHNMYLGMLVNYGIIGLLLFLFMTFKLYSIVDSNYHNLSITNNDVYSRAALVALVLIWILIYFNLGQYQNSRDYWFLLALVCSSGRL